MGEILVTGGIGFIGTNLVKELRGRGHSVWTTDLRHSALDQHNRADVSSYPQMERIFAGRRFDFVFHLAAEYGRWNGEDYYENLWRTNTIGTKHMIRLQERYRFKMIYFSSAEVYGDYDGLMSEDVMERVPIVQLNDYAIGKWAGEMQCLNSAAMHGTETVRVRPVNCYGPHEHYHEFRGVVPTFVYSALAGQPFTVHRGHRRIFDYVEDTRRTLANICDNFIPGEAYNIGSQEDWDVSIEELAETVLAITGADSRLAEFVEAEDWTTRVKRIDYSKSRRDLGHKAEIPIEEGIRRYAEWMREIYGL